MPFRCDVLLLGAPPRRPPDAGTKDSHTTRTEPTGSRQHPVDMGGTYYAVTGRSRGQRTMLKFIIERNRVTHMLSGAKSVVATHYECA